MVKEAEKETAIIEKYKDPIIKKLEGLRDKRLLSELCRTKLNIPSSRLTEMMTGKKKITPYYLKMFLDAGIISVKEITEKEFTDLEIEDQVLFARLTMDTETILLIAKIREQNRIDLKEILKAIVKDE